MFPAGLLPPLSVPPAAAPSPVIPPLPAVPAALSLPGLPPPPGLMTSQPLATFTGNAELVTRLQQELNTRFLQDRGLLPLPPPSSTALAATTRARSGMLTAQTPFIFTAAQTHHHQHPLQNMPALDPKVLYDATLLRRSVNSAELTQTPNHFPSNLAANSLPASSFSSVNLPAALPLSDCLPSFDLVSARISATGAFQPTAGSCSSVNPASQLLLALRDRDQSLYAQSSHDHSFARPPFAASASPLKKHGRWCAAHVHIAWNTHVRKHHSHLVNGQRHTTGLLQRLTLPSHIQPHPFGFCDATDFAHELGASSHLSSRGLITSRAFSPPSSSLIDTRDGPSQNEVEPAARDRRTSRPSRTNDSDVRDKAEERIDDDRRRSPSGTLHPRDASTTVRSRSRSRSRSPRGYSSGRHLGQMNGDDIFTLRSSLSSADVSLSRPWFTLPVLRNTGTDSQRYGANPFVSLSGRVLLSLISRVHSSTKSSSSQPSAEPPTSTTAADDRRTAPKLLVRPPAGDVQVPAYLDFRSRDSAENTNELAASCIV